MSSIRPHRGEDKGDAVWREKTYETALLFRDLGVSTVPIDPKKKRPPARVLWRRRYGGRLPPPRSLRRWFLWRGWALALVCGVTLAVRDFDRAEAYHRWAGEHPDLAGRLPTAATRRGFHVYHRCGFEHWQKLPDGEYIASPRHYVLAPPSPHPKGGRYRWVVPPGGGVPLVGPVAAGLLPTPATASARPAGRHPLTDCGNFDPAAGPSGVEAAVRRTLPAGHGERHHCLWRLALALKRLPGLADASAESLLSVVQEWHRRALPNIRTEDFAATWRDFTDAWGNAERGCGLDGLRAWLDLHAPAGRGEANLLRLELACEWLQQLAGEGPFFLACRKAGGLLGVSHTAARKLIDRLVRCGFLLKEWPAAGRGFRRANEFFLAGPGVLSLAGANHHEQGG